MTHDHTKCRLSQNGAALVQIEQNCPYMGKESTSGVSCIHLTGGWMWTRDPLIIANFCVCPDQTMDLVGFCSRCGHVGLELIEAAHDFAANNIGKCPNCGAINYYR